MKTWWRKIWNIMGRDFTKAYPSIVLTTLILWVRLEREEVESDEFDYIVEQAWAIREGLA